MSDGRLRDAERRWKETGSVEDGSAYLQELLRSGHVSRAQLDLLAYAGDAFAARLVELRRPGWLRGWVIGLLRFQGLGSRAACVAAFGAAGLSEDVPSVDSNRRRASALAWLECPCEEHALGVARERERDVTYGGRRGDFAAFEAVYCATKGRRRRCLGAALSVDLWVEADARATILPCMQASVREWVRLEVQRAVGSAG